MRTALERTYGFDKTITYPGIAVQRSRENGNTYYEGYLPKTLFDFVATTMQIPVYEVIDHRYVHDEEVFFTIADSDFQEQGVTEVAYGSRDFRLQERNLRINIAKRLLSLWKGNEDGYTEHDYEQFVHRVNQQVDHIIKSWDGQGAIHKTQFMSIYNSIFDNTSTVYSWRYSALRMMENADIAVLLPRTFDVSYGTLADSIEELQDRSMAAKAILRVRCKNDTSAYRAKLLNMFDIAAVNETTGNLQKKRNFGLFRHIELNEFFQHGTADQTLEDFLTNTPWIEDRVKSLMVHDYGETTAVLNQELLFIEVLPFFMRLYDFMNMPVGVQKILLTLTRDQLYEMYENPRKRPEIVRTDVKSRTKKYVEEFIQGFFEEESHVVSYDTTRKDCDEKLFQLILSGDMTSYFVARHYLPTHQGIVFYDTTTVPAQRIIMDFFEDMDITSIFLEDSKRFVFQVFYQHGGFENRSMVDMMLIAYCFRTPKLFAQDTGSAQGVLTILANEVLQDKMNAHTAVTFILDAATYSGDVVPLVTKEALENIAQYVGYNPAEWYMPLITLQDRTIQQPSVFKRLSSALV